MGWNYRNSEGVILHFGTRESLVTHLKSRGSSDSSDSIPSGELWHDDWLLPPEDAGVNGGQGSQRPSRNPESPVTSPSASPFELVVRQVLTKMSGSAFVIFPRPNGAWSWSVPPDEAPDNGDFSDPYEALNAAMTWAFSQV